MIINIYMGNPQVFLSSFQTVNRSKYELLSDKITDHKITIDFRPVVTGNSTENLLAFHVYLLEKISKSQGNWWKTSKSQWKISKSQWKTGQWVNKIRDFLQKSEKSLRCWKSANFTDIAWNLSNHRKFLTDISLNKFHLTLRVFLHEYRGNLLLLLDHRK